MKFSIWNQIWEHDETIRVPPEKTYQQLLKHYKQSPKSFVLDKENAPNTFSFHRGNVLVSALGLGSELWCKHFIEVVIKEIENGESQINWKINLKVFGFQAGTNAIIEECKRVVSQNA